MSPQYVIGIDFGTDSVRSIIADCSNGEEVAASVSYYKRWKEQKYCNASKNQFRQYPSDYTESLEDTLKNILSHAGKEISKNIRAISVDTTGSTPVAVDKEGLPLSLNQSFVENPNGMFMLWKDHTSVNEANEITQLCKEWGGVDYTRFSGGVYSSEWFWAKLLHIIREDNDIAKNIFSFVEHCDWITAELTGNTNPLTLKRSRCAAGHKAMWHQSYNGLPGKEFLSKLHPLLAEIKNNLYTETYTSNIGAGNLSQKWADKLGLSTDIVVGVGALDAHMGAVGGQIEPNILNKVIGTSTCDMVVVPHDQIGDKLIHGICGQVDGSIIPGMVGLEAGQSAFGDIYAWFANLFSWPLEKLDFKSGNDIHGKILNALNEGAAKIPIKETDIVAIDWMNGRRTPDANQLLKGAISGLTLGSDATRIYKSLVEATAFGAKKIVERFIEEGIEIKGVTAIGGIPKKSSFVMQVLADVLNMPIHVSNSEQACALGAAMFASVCAGIHPDIITAQEIMGHGFECEYKPIPENAEKYKKLYSKYTQLAKFIEDFVLPSS